ncbi:MAG TPA: hypothetical protein VIE89_33120 [Candidatus Binatia bacterium]|jgi:hypothetical protein
MQRYLIFMIVLLLGAVLAVRLWAQPPGKNTLKTFQGYWMGVDPLDGGDSRRSLVRQQNGTYSLAGRDSYLTLCDNTDRGFIAFDDGGLVNRGEMRTDNLKITCFNTGAVVLLKARYVLIDDGVMAEVTTAQDGTPVDTIIFHKVSGK